MSSKAVCPMCHQQHETVPVDYGYLYKCQADRTYYIFDIVLSCDDVEKERRLNAIYHFIEQKPYLNNYTYWQFYYEVDKYYDNVAFINVADLMKDYPSNVSERLDRILLKLANKYPLLTDRIDTEFIIYYDFRLLYCESKNTAQEVMDIFSALHKLKYLEVTSQPFNQEYRTIYKITVEGWRRIEELKRQNKTSRQAFIAMSFDPSVSNIEVAFKTAINDAGYEPRIIKDKEHNNYIMPEIFYEIKNSRFVVVDVTKPNYGAYYEAGFAQALGKEVIVCCQKDVFDNPQTKPHFDIAQKSTIVWKDENDLVERLKKRIKATVI